MAASGGDDEKTFKDFLLAFGRKSAAAMKTAFAEHAIPPRTSVVTPNDLLTILEAEGVMPTPTQFALLVEEADPDASGEVQYSKLMSVFRDMQKALRQRIEEEEAAKKQKAEEEAAAAAKAASDAEAAAAAAAAKSAGKGKKKAKKGSAPEIAPPPSGTAKPKKSKKGKKKKSKAKAKGKSGAVMEDASGDGGSSGDDETGLTAAQVRHAREVFSTLIDKDGDGIATARELKRLFKELDMAYSDVEIYALINEMDTENVGGITINEFLAYLDRVSANTGRLLLDESLAYEAPRPVGDGDGGGAGGDGDDDDLDGGLDAPGMAVDAIFDFADANGDGQATLGEFRDAMTTMGLDVDDPEVSGFLDAIPLSAGATFGKAEARHAMFEARLNTNLKRGRSKSMDRRRKRKRNLQSDGGDAGGGSGGSKAAGGRTKSAGVGSFPSLSVPPRAGGVEDEIQELRDEMAILRERLQKEESEKRARERGEAERRAAAAAASAGSGKKKRKKRKKKNKRGAHDDEDDPLLGGDDGGDDGEGCCTIL